MGHNRKKRQAEVDARYEFVVYGGEYSILHPALAIADAILTRGLFTYEFLAEEGTKLGIDLARAMTKAGLDPTSETLYFDYFIFQNWEGDDWYKVPLPNKFVPYVAARRKRPDQSKQGWEGVARDGIAGKVKQVSIGLNGGQDKAVVTVSDQDKAYLYQGKGRWEELAGHSVSQVSVADGEYKYLLYGMSPTGGVIRYHATKGTWEGVGTEAISGKVNQVSLGQAGGDQERALVVVSDHDKAYRYLGNSRWKELEGRSVSRVSVADGRSKYLLYGVSPKGDVVRYHTAKRSWEQVGLEGIKGQVKQVSMGGARDGYKAIVVVSDIERAYRYLGNGRWEELDGHSVSQISVADSQFKYLAYGVSPSGGVVRRFQ